MYFETVEEAQANARYFMVKTANEGFPVEKLQIWKASPKHEQQGKFFFAHQIWKSFIDSDEHDFICDVESG